MLEAELIATNADLAENVASRSDELGRARQEVLRHLAIAAEFRDDDTGEHPDRVSRGAATLARGFGLQQDAVRLIASAAPLHDIGKIGIPDRILLKHGKLTVRERQIMQTHTQIGAAILSDSEVAELKMAEAIALYHHEHWDGGGYPHGVSGVSIPLAARVVAVADVFDALVFPRPYKEAWPIADALCEIEAQAGKQFDPGLVEVFLGLDHEELRSSTHTDVGAVQRRAVFDAAAAARLSSQPRARAGEITPLSVQAPPRQPSSAVG
jgi:putative two-component system response regulator